MRAYRTIDPWLRAAIATEPRDEPAKWWPDVVSGSRAACVTIRLAGGVMASASETPESGADTSAWRRAAERAARGARERLPAEHDALRDEALARLAGEITISLELAGPFVPISPKEYSDAAAELSPGIDGVAVRLGDRTVAMFPEAMLVAGMDAGRALASLVSNITDDPGLSLKKPAELAATREIGFYRFRTIHLAQTGPDLPPVFLYRGGRVVEGREITTESLRTFADDLARHLSQRCVPLQAHGSPPAGAQPWNLQGVLNPVLGRFESPTASAHEQATAALALLRYARTPGVAPAAATAAARLGAGLLLGLTTSNEQRPAAAGDGVAAAVALAAVREMKLVGAGPAPPEIDRLAAECADGVLALFSEKDGFSSAVPANALGVIAAGIASAESLRGGPMVKGAAAVRAVFGRTPPGHLVDQMPWLGWAELMATPAGAPIASATALREMRKLVWDHQLSMHDATRDTRDLQGGIVFTAARVPLPTWQSERPLAFIAGMLGDPRLTDEAEVLPEVSRLTASLRFVKQLSADEALGHMYRAGPLARGGVRASLWDQRMPPDATSLALITVCETLRSFEAAGKRPRESR